MIHKYAIVIELEYNDEAGEYVPPSTREIENKIVSAITRPLEHMGFETDTVHIEASKGSLQEAFGIGRGWHK